MNRLNTRSISVGNVVIGGNDHIVIQSMTTTHTKDIEATIKQIKELESIGCEVIRVAILDFDDALALTSIKKAISIPLVADIHFDYNLAIEAIKHGADKIRINPGNMPVDKVKAVIETAKEYNVPIRIGVNSGSIEKEFANEEHKVALFKSICKYISLLESFDFHNIVLSAKSTDIDETIWINEQLTSTYDYPIHLGLTEAGDVISASVRSSIALGKLLEEGIGNTIRVSINGNPKNEIICTKELLNSLKLIKNTPNLIACPTCGRCQINLESIVNEVREFLNTVKKDITVAVMGCPVNGPGEASHADIGIAGSINGAVLFKHSKVYKSIQASEKEIASILIEEIKEIIK